jgi:hypothetical protein
MASTPPVAKREPRSAGTIGFFAILLAAMLWIPTHAYEVEEGRIVGSQPGAYSGDEPHYLVTINSLLFDADLALQEDYLRARRGGWEAGWRHLGRPMPHHTILVDPETGEHALWLDECRFGRVDRCWAFDRPIPGPRIDDRFPHRYSTLERSAHPVAFAAIVATALAPFRPSIEEVESGIAIFMGIAAWLGTLLTYRVARALRLSARTALTASMLLAVASPWLVYTRSVYPATVAGVALIGALLAILDRRIVLAALATAIAAAMKPMLALVAIAWVGVLLLQRRFRDAIRFTSCVAACGASVGAFNYWMAGTPMVFGAVTPSAMINTDAAIFDTLLHPAYGLLLFAPWSIAAIVHLIKMRPFSFGENMRPLGWVTAALIPTLILLSLFPYLGANCYGPRYWVPFLPWLALASAAGIENAGRVGQVSIGGLAGIGMMIAIPAAILYPSVWDSAPQTALLLFVEHLSR